MRGCFGLMRNSNGVVRGKVIGEAAKLVSCSTFSTSSSGGSRGRGSFEATTFDFIGGHGRGKPLPSSPLPSFNSFVASDQPSPQLQDLSRGRGGVISQPSELGNAGESMQQQGLSRGRGRVISQPSELGIEGESPQQQGLSRGQGGVISQPSELGNKGESRPKGPVFYRKDEEFDDSKPSQPIGEKTLPQNMLKKLPQTMLNVLPGSGGGMPVRKSVSDEKPKEQNRHLRARGDGSVAGRGKDRLQSKEGMHKLSREEAVMRAMGILAKQDGNSGGRGRGIGRGRGDDEGSEESEDEDEDFMGDDADCEELAQKLGPARMSELTVAFEDLSTDVLPDPVMGECIGALDTNLQIELEPEYLFGDFETNPNINETPPISLEDTLEKMKPFLMAYEGNEYRKEWEEVMKETMEKVPLMKEIVDHYCGPDRVTAKQQQAELERVAKTLPASALDSVVPFTDRAVRSLQSNPGWGFNKKIQLLDKMVAEFSTIYK